MTKLPPSRISNVRLSAHKVDSAEVPQFFFFNDTATTEIYTLSLHDALPISCLGPPTEGAGPADPAWNEERHAERRSEEHTSELQSQSNLVCRLLLEKKN